MDHELEHAVILTESGIQTNAFRKRRKAGIIIIGKTVPTNARSSCVRTRDHRLISTGIHQFEMFFYLTMKYTRSRQRFRFGHVEIVC